MARQVHHLEKIVGRAVAALPNLERHKQIGRELVRRRGGISDGDLQRRVRLRDGGHDEQRVILDESATTGVAKRALQLAVRGIGVRQEHRVGEQISLGVIQ